jgi:hypothetical protein
LNRSLNQSLFIRVTWFAVSIICWEQSWLIPWFCDFTSWNLELRTWHYFISTLKGWSHSAAISCVGPNLEPIPYLNPAKKLASISNGMITISSVCFEWNWKNKLCLIDMRSIIFLLS